MRVAGRCGELLLARGDTDRALVLPQQALAVEAWSEPAHRLVVAAHLACRDTGMARRALDQYRKMLVELGSSPDEAIAELERLLETAELT